MELKEFQETIKIGDTFTIKFNDPFMIQYNRHHVFKGYGECASQGNKEFPFACAICKGRIISDINNFLCIGTPEENTSVIEISKG